MSIIGFFFIYLFGGVTFIPICIISWFFFLKWYFPTYPGFEEKIKNDDLSPFSDKELSEKYRKLKVTENEEKENEGVRVFKSGWLTVTAEYVQLPSTSFPEKPEQADTAGSSTNTFYNLMKSKAFKSSDPVGEDIDSDKASYSGNSSGKKPRKNRYFAVLRHGNLFLYKDENLDDVLHVIVLSNYVISVWPRNIPDGQLFSKISAICIIRKSISKYTQENEAESFNDNSSTSQQDNAVSTFEILEKGTAPPNNTSFFLYPDRNYDKEDWYFDLIRATKLNSSQITEVLDEDYLLNPSVFAETLHPRTADMISLIQNLYSSEGQLHTRWFNSIIGRVFLAVYKTEKFENAIKDKLMDKLQKINKPGFLDEFKIEKVFVGRGAPLFGSPRLISLTPEGQLDVETSILYNGGISFEVSTKVNINLGTRFKQRDISILLAVTIQNVKGTMRFQLKKPPSDRLWWCFSEMPEIDIEVEPVVSSRQITTGMITRTIENRLKTSIKESLVYPSMDDIAFFSTTEEVFRGGIWNKENRRTFSEQEISEFLEKRCDSESARSIDSRNYYKGAESVKSMHTTGSNEANNFSKVEANTNQLNQSGMKISETKANPKIVIGAQYDFPTTSNSLIFNLKNKDIRGKAANTFRSVTKAASVKMNKVSNDNSYKTEEVRQSNGKLIDLSDMSPEEMGKDTKESPVFKGPKMISSRRRKRSTDAMKDEGTINNSDILEHSKTENSLDMAIFDIETTQEASEPTITYSSLSSSTSQPYMKVPEMSFPVRSPSKNSLDAFDSSNSNKSIKYVRRAPPKDSNEDLI